MKKLYFLNLLRNIFISYLIFFQGQGKTLAIENEIRIPTKVIQFDASISNTQISNEAYDAYGNRQPFWKMIIHDKTLHKKI